MYGMRVACRRLSRLYSVAWILASLTVATASAIADSARQEAIDAAEQLVGIACTVPEIAEQSVLDVKGELGGSIDASLTRLLATLNLEAKAGIDLKVIEGMADNLKSSDKRAVLERLLDCRREVAMSLFRAGNGEVGQKVRPMFGRIAAIDSAGYDLTTDYQLDRGPDGKCVIPEVKPEADPERTNADDIADILGERLGKFDILERDVYRDNPKPLQWSARQVGQLNPKLVFIHWSTFERRSSPDRTAVDCSLGVGQSAFLANACNKTFVHHLNELARQAREATIIAYTRTPGACGSAPTLFQHAEEQDEIEEDALKRTVFVEMMEPNRCRGGSFKTSAGRKIIADLAELVLFGRGVSEIAEEYDPKVDGVCLLSQ